MMPRNDSGFPDAGDQPPSRPDVNPIAGRIDPLSMQPRPEQILPPA